MSDQAWIITILAILVVCQWVIVGILLQMRRQLDTLA